MGRKHTYDIPQRRAGRSGGPGYRYVPQQCSALLGIGDPEGGHSINGTVDDIFEAYEELMDGGVEDYRDLESCDDQYAFRKDPDVTRTRPSSGEIQVAGYYRRSIDRGDDPSAPVDPSCINHFF